jgi:hypothetical protein
MSDMGPGWWPDPTGQHEMRWWDGTRWTEDVMDGGHMTPGGLPAGPPSGPFGPTGPQRPPATGPTGSTGGSSRLPFVLAGVGALVVLVIIAVAVAVVVAGGDDDDEQASSTTTEPQAEVFLEAAESEGENPFTESFAMVSTTDVADLGPELPTPGGGSGDDVVLAEVSASTPGLYGGTRDDSSCDQAAMAAFLEDEPELQAAWAEVQDLQPSAVSSYVEGLTPVQLLADTRVTNHGYEDGEAVPIDAVLQAGTAVLVDSTGTPRARCACGNPLTPPEAVTEGAVFAGDEWDGFDQADLVVVAGEGELNELALTDVDGGDEFVRPIGTSGNADLGTGDVRATLTWQDDADLDLHVIDPAGEEIYYSSTSSSTGGQLDLDTIPDCGDVATHAENVFWPPGGAPDGTYEAFVVDYRSGCDDQPTSFTLEVYVGSDLVDSIDGTLYGDQSQSIVFDVG